MPQRTSLRRCLLLLGTAALAGGRPVHEVEAELRRMGAALGEPSVSCAATPTGLFVSLSGDEAAGFEGVGAPLRFDQLAGVTEIGRRVLARELGPEAAVEELDAVLAARPHIPRAAAAAGLLLVGAGLALILQPAWANVLVALVGSLVVAGFIELAARVALVATLLPVIAAFSVGCLIFGAAEAGLLDGPLRTLLAPIAGLLLVGAGLALILQPAWENVLAALVGSLLVAGFIELASRVALVATLLPVIAAFSVGCLIFGAAEADLLDGPLRTLLAPIAVLLPGALIVTGMSELAAGAMVAGTARLVFGTVQLGLFTFGVLAAVRVVGAEGELSNLRVDELGAWAPWAGLVLVGVGVFLNVSAPRGALPWMLGLLGITFLVQTAGQAAYGAPFGAFAGAVVAALGAAVVERLPHGPPSLVVFLPAFWLLVPGSLGLVGTTQLAGDSGDGLAVASGAIGVIVAIALGVLVGSALGRALDRPRR